MLIAVGSRSLYTVKVVCSKYLTLISTQNFFVEPTCYKYVQSTRRTSKFTELISNLFGELTVSILNLK